METKHKRVPKLVLTGGPCAGKTTALQFLEKKFIAHGYYPLIVHEAATALLSAGITILDASGDMLPFQRAVLRHILSFEEKLESVLRSLLHSRPVLICDRGVMDSLAYVNPKDFHALLLEHGLGHPAVVRDGRYDAVIHLRTAAMGAPEFFSSASNVHRYEKDLSEAIALDERTLAAWLGHQHLAVVGNTYGSFEGKLDAVWSEACRLLGIPEPREIEKKFLVKPIDFYALGIPHEVIEITQYYLTLSSDDESVSRVRSWGQDKGETYTLTRKRQITLGVLEEIEEQISATAFAQYTKYQKEGTVCLQKRRTCFVWKDQYFMYDEFVNGRPGLTLLELELQSHGAPFELPPFVSVYEDVSHNRTYFSSTIAGVK